MMDGRRARWEARYQSGITPWDTGITPPEVVDFWSRQSPADGAWALDLGCGTGTNVAFLAEQGLNSVGVELAGAALVQARVRRMHADRVVASRMHFAAADVAHLPFAGMQACYALDVGCFHGVPPAERAAYVAGVDRNLAPGGYYHLFGFDRVPALVEQNPERGLEPDEVVERFGPRYRTLSIIQAKPDRYPCRWYLLQKQTGS